MSWEIQSISVLASPSQISFPSTPKQTVEALMETVETLQYSFSTLSKTSILAPVPSTQMTPMFQMVVTKLLHAEPTGVMRRTFAKLEPNSVKTILLFTAVSIARKCVTHWLQKMPFSSHTNSINRFADAFCSMTKFSLRILAKNWTPRLLSQVQLMTMNVLTKKSISSSTSTDSVSIANTAPKMTVHYLSNTAHPSSISALNSVVASTKESACMNVLMEQFHTLVFAENALQMKNSSNLKELLKLSVHNATDPVQAHHTPTHKTYLACTLRTKTTTTTPVTTITTTTPVTTITTTTTHVTTTDWRKGQLFLAKIIILSEMDLL